MGWLSRSGGKWAWLLGFSEPLRGPWGAGGALSAPPAAVVLLKHRHKARIKTEESEARINMGTACRTREPRAPSGERVVSSGKGTGKTECPAAEK